MLNTHPLANIAANMASSASLIPQKRKGVTDNERAVLRKRNREHPSSQAQLINWFTKESGHKLSQAQISRTLSSKYDCIDNLDKKTDKRPYRHKNNGKAIGKTSNCSTSWPCESPHCK